MEVETWVRMEGGDIVTLIFLNETYGRDRYPIVDGEGSHRCDTCLPSYYPSVR